MTLLIIVFEAGGKLLFLRLLKQTIDNVVKFFIEYHDRWLVLIHLSYCLL